MKKILALSASNSSKSINTILVNIAAQKIQNHKVKIINIIDYPMPIYSSDNEENNGFPKATKKLLTLINEHNAFIIASPEHNGSMPAVFKNTIDWMSRANGGAKSMFQNKPMLLLSTSPGEKGGSNNLNTLKNIMPHWGANVIATYSLGKFHEHYNNGKLDSQTDADISNIIKQFTQQIN